MSPTYYTEQPVLSTRHMLSRFMPYFANCSLTIKVLSSIRVRHILSEITL